MREQSSSRREGKSPRVGTPPLPGRFAPPWASVTTRPCLAHRGPGPNPLARNLKALADSHGRRGMGQESETAKHRKVSGLPLSQN